MPPQLILFALEELIENEPEIADEIRSLMNKPNPTRADWQAARARVLAKSYADYDSLPFAAPLPAAFAAAAVPITVLPATVATAAPTPDPLVVPAATPASTAAPIHSTISHE